MANYQIGDKALDKNGKIFEVESIIEQDFGTGLSSFLIMKPCFDYDYSKDYRFYVPLKNADNILHPLMTKEEAEKFIQEIPNIAEYPETNPRERKVIFQNLISNGNREDICRIIKFLISYRNKRKMINKSFSEFDSRLLKNLKDMIRNELSLALNIPTDSVASYIINRTGDSSLEM